MIRRRHGRRTARDAVFETVTALTTHKVYVMNGNGSGQARLTNSPATTEHPRIPLMEARSPLFPIATAPIASW